MVINGHLITNLAFQAWPGRIKQNFGTWLKSAQYFYKFCIQVVFKALNHDIEAFILLLQCLWPEFGTIS